MRDGVDKADKKGEVKGGLLLTPALKRDLAAVESILRRQVGSRCQLINRISGYALRGRGKRIRPLLLLLSARLCGNEDGLRPVRLASVGEALHVAALIHDDIIDDSPLRRGRPSANARWGTGFSVLAGDYLYSRSLQYLIEEEDREVMRAFVGATLEMVEGEMMEQEMAGRWDVSLAEYLEMITHKTASLFSACCRVGAMVSAAPPEWIAALGRFGLDLGVAFQIVDDALDLIAEERTLGKPVGQDLGGGKITFPLIHILSEGSGPDREALRRLLADDRARKEGEGWQREIRGLIVKCGAVDRSCQIARRYVERAKGHLEIFPACQARSTLLELADYTVARDR